MDKNELSLDISTLLDGKFESKFEILDTSKRYLQETDHIKELSFDVSTIKSAIHHHIKQQKKIS